MQIERFLADKAEHGRLDGTGGLGAASVNRLQVTLHKSMKAAVRKGLLSVTRSIWPTSRRFQPATSPRTYGLPSR